MANEGFSKMGWLADNIKRNKVNYRIRKTKATHGTVVLPTGVGKSAEIFIDMYWNIVNAKPGSKLVLNISAPQLILVQQQTCDFLATLSMIKELLPDKKLVFYINSSDVGKNYNSALKEMNLNCKKFKTDFNKFFYANSEDEIAIVASCHKSLNKFIDKCAKLKKDGVKFDAVTYIDECHLIDFRKNNADDNISTIKLDKLCTFSSVYAMTATPNHEVTKRINSYNRYGSKSNRLLYSMSPIEAISHNLIVKPKVYTRQTNNNGITADVLELFMEFSKLDNPDINHKMLVTCKSSDELRAMKIELQRLGYKVFSTCSRYGYGIEDEGVDSEYADINEFKDDVDGYEGDCFVLHIRQLIQGIDIKSISDVVLWCQDINNPMTARHVVQTIGRSLRPLPGERGLCEKKRKKKHANVYILSNDANDYQRCELEKFVMNTYALDNHDFYNSHSGYRVLGKGNLDTGNKVTVKKEISLNQEIVAVMLNVETYIKEKLRMKKRLYSGIGKVLNINREIDAIIRQYKLSDMMGTDDVLSNEYVRMFKDISKLCKKYGIG